MRRPTFTAEVAEAAEDLVRQAPPPENDRATWTLHGLATALQEQFAHIASISHETVRRLLHRRGIPRRGYRHAKEWLTSPDPLYAVRKARRDRLLAMARATPDGAAIWLDQSWFIRWPYRFWNWASDDDLPRVAKRWSEKVQTTALYAALDDESQATFLDWADGQPNSDRTTAFLEALMAHWNEQDKRFIVLFWDHAPWHTSKQTRNWIRAYNRRAKQDGLTRLIVSSPKACLSAVRGSCHSKQYSAISNIKCSVIVSSTPLLLYEPLSNGIFLGVSPQRSSAETQLWLRPKNQDLFCESALEA